MPPTVFRNLGRWGAGETLLARLTALTMALGATALAAPAAFSPVELASGYCVQIDGVDDCFNPCNEASGPYNEVRRTTGAGGVLPPLYCVQ